ncbi:hypothetical protein VMCG_04348 [Cytospora schulzeri]|uniref:Uncharacterized protein n=1 Tax=Cytospora schulzeri TaxID=448051 RepID=A0A423WSH6_9PEZI|nr:hypothetical protein VMCG_04348 [Valsa malicola]
MQHNHGHHSKGKGKDKGKERDLVDGFDRLSLGDSSGHSVPRSDQHSHQYYQTEYSSLEQYPPGNDEYTYQSQSYDNAASNPAYGDQYGYEATFPTTARNATTTGGASSSYESSYVPSGYAASSYTDSSSYTSSYAPSSYASSGYAQSFASTTPSTAPPRRLNNTVDHQIAQQPPAQNRYELPCEFQLLTGCTIGFQDGEEREWKEHHEAHMRGKFPSKLNCWFCETFTFDAKQLYGGDKSYNFEMRMEHIRGHIVEDGYGASSMRPDGRLIRHLRHERIISDQTYNDIMDRLNPRTVPPIPGYGHSQMLDQVVEEPASSSRDRRHEKKDKHESSKKKHKR